MLFLTEMDAVEAATSQAAFITPDQLSEDLVTLTLLPSSRWKTLLNLETIAVSRDHCRKYI